ncbi:MAG TPA: hypothetical protein VF198_03540 [Vicinamibacterales bacterium]
MSINPLQTASPIEQLARSLVDRFDVNRDGQLTTDEFTTVLSSLADRARSAAAGVAGAEGARPQDLPPAFADGRKALEPLLAGNLSEPALQHAKSWLVEMVRRYADVASLPEPGGTR